MQAGAGVQLYQAGAGLATQGGGGQYGLFKGASQRGVEVIGGLLGPEDPRAQWRALDDLLQGKSNTLLSPASLSHPLQR
ncbi:hypothetical protein D3C75_935740 [compost metagenome]